MKTKFYILVVVTATMFLGFIPLKMMATDFTITFTSTGASTTFDNVVVQNLTQGKTTTVPSGSALNLIDVTALNEPETGDLLTVFPIPIVGKAKTLYYSEQGGAAQIEIIGIDGKNVLSNSNVLNAGINAFELTLPNGVFTLLISENGKLVSSKIISQSNNNKASIHFAGNEKMQNINIQKSKSSDVPFTYNTGDIFLFKGVSGNYSCVVAEKIAGNKNINFNFVECKDADGNYYTTVTLGTQVWMAENLKTTKYRNGVSITNLTDNDAWMKTTAGAWCNYNNDAANGTKYGHIYNFHALADSRIIAPPGWHVPTRIEWQTLIVLLGNWAEAGGKLKESGALNWKSPNVGATNLSGFTALPGGYRYRNGVYTFINEYAYWWAFSKFDTDNFDAFFVSYEYNMIFPDNETAITGLYVRCVKD